MDSSTNKHSDFAASDSSTQNGAAGEWPNRTEMEAQWEAGSVPAAPRRVAIPATRLLFTFFVEQAKGCLLEFVKTGALWRNASRLPVPKPFRTEPTDWRKFREKWGWLLGDESDDDLTELRDELRAHWEQGTLLDLSFRLVQRPQATTFGTVKLWPDRTGTVHLPALFDFTRALAYAILDLAPRLAHCENPDCRAPYFLGRRTQRFCGRDACDRVVQRQWKRDWWKAHGPAWRRRAKKSSTARRRPPKKP